MVDALRNTITVIVPIFIFFYLNFPLAAIGVGTGALLICLTDLAGSRSDKLSGALISIPLFFGLAVLTALSLDALWALSVLAFVFTFVLIMFASLSKRMGAIGIMGIGIIAFTIGHRPQQAFEYGFYIAIGGTWYYLVSISQAWLFPYHALQRALAKTSKDTASFIRLRAMGYDQEAPLAGFNIKNINLHLKLTQNHELVRSLLLGDKFNGNFKDNSARQLLSQSILLIDLYEQVSALHHDYLGMRKNLNGLGILDPIRQAILLIADSLEGKACNRDQYQKLILGIESIHIQSEYSKQMVEGIVSNLKKTAALVYALEDKKELDASIQIEHFPSFLTEGKLSYEKMKSQLNYDSQIFRFALRMSALMLILVFSIGFLPGGSYGYWLPITLIVISRPSYGMTLKRNIERVIGTLLGLVLAWALIEINLDQYVLLGICVVAMFIFFGFLLLRYWLSAMGITVAVVLCLSIYHGHAEQILSERLLFTILGCVIGLAATFLFPIRHSLHLKTAVQHAISSNRDYLARMLESSSQLIEIKLARKSSYLALSALNEAISIASREPRWKRRNLEAIRQLELLCFQMNALTAAIPPPNDQNHTGNPKSKASVLTVLDVALQGFSSLHHEQIYKLNPLRRVDGILDLNNVAFQLGEIISFNQK